MARTPRLEAPGLPLHIIQRGVDRQPCFARDWDYLRYLKELAECAARHDCEIHAYVLMTNHVHLLATGHFPGAISLMMQRLGRRYVGYFNRSHARIGTLWEGRFKSCLIDTEEYLLGCQRYIELNPVRAGMVAIPDQFRWSSYRSNALGEPDALVKPHSAYLALSPDRTRCCARYREFVGSGTPAAELAQLREHAQQGKAWGSARFQAQVEALLGRRCEVRAKGRPSQPNRK
jgi:putative transposase